MNIKILNCLDINRENFASYGQFVSEAVKPADALTPEFHFWNALGVTDISGQVSVCIVRGFPQKPVRETALERHLRTGETLIPTGDIIIVAALSHKGKPDLPDPATARAFLVKKGSAVIFHPGVWHHAPLAAGEASNTFIVFDKSTPEEDFLLVELEKEFGYIWEIR